MTSRRQKRTRAGLAFVWTIISITAILSFAAMGVDVAFWYMKKAALQTAADAAALAGAYDLGRNGLSDRTNADVAATAYAQYNGASMDTAQAKKSWDNGPGNNGTDFPATTAHPNWFRVHVMSTVAPIFSGILGIGQLTIRASATAQFTGVIDQPIPQNVAGLAPGKTCNGNTVPYNYSAFGPSAQHQYGDNYSPKYLQNNTINPQNSPGNPFQGYDFDLTPSASYTSTYGNTMQVELWDPDTYNQGGQIDASSTAVDEIRSSQTGNPIAETNKPDNTQFDLIYTPFDTGVDQTIASATYDGSGGMAIYDGYEPAASLAKLNGVSPAGIGWVTPSGFTINLSSYDPTKGRIHVREQTLDGASENGYSLRAGPVHTTNSQGISMVADCSWNTSYGGAVMVSSHGLMPMNFDLNGTATITLGTVPSAAAGGTFNITRFDTDVGFVSITYSNSLGESFTANMGPVGANDVETTDTITLPSNYTQATWYATYAAGGGDTSTWKLGYTGGGHIDLVGEPGGLT